MSDTAAAAAAWTGLARLRQYTRSQRARAAERCEFCGVEIGAPHGHLVNLQTRTILCVCRPCYLLFAHDGAGGTRFRSVPDRYVSVSADGLSDAAWDALQIPIGLAFFFRNGATGRVTAFYPSPAGATESELPLDAWDEVVRSAPALADLQSDVEALLVRRADRSAADAAAGQPIDAFIVPIDACYELVGRIRQRWRGFHGGDDVWGEVEVFFARARTRAASDGVEVRG